MAETRHQPSRAERLGYEPTDVDIKAILLTVLVLAVVVGLFATALLGLVALFQSTSPLPTISMIDQVQPVPPPPRLEANPAQVLVQIRQHEQQILDSYGRVDRDAGIARIPIAEAMGILSERGWTSKIEPDDAAASTSPDPVESGQ